MSNNQIIELQSMISTADSNNEIVEKLKDYITKKSNEKRVNWQMLACYLDGKIFEFIMQNQNDPRIKDFGIELARDLANKFGINH